MNKQLAHLQHTIELSTKMGANEAKSEKKF